MDRWFKGNLLRSLKVFPVLTVVQMGPTRHSKLIGRKKTDSSLSLVLTIGMLSERYVGVKNPWTREPRFLIRHLPQVSKSTVTLNFLPCQSSSLQQTLKGQITGTSGPIVVDLDLQLPVFTTKTSTSNYPFLLRRFLVRGNTWGPGTLWTPKS